MRILWRFGNDRYGARSDQSRGLACALKSGESVIDVAGAVLGRHCDANAAGGVRNGGGANRRSIYAFRHQVFGERERGFGIADEDRHDRTDAGGQAES